MRARLLIILMAVLALCSASGLLAADPAPFDYKQSIRNLVALENPELTNLRFTFYKPKKVAFGDKALQRTAVRCSWSVRGPHGEVYLGGREGLFLVDGGFIVEVKRDDHLTWLEGVPGIQDLEQEK